MVSPPEKRPVGKDHGCGYSCPFVIPLLSLNAHKCKFTPQTAISELQETFCTCMKAYVEAALFRKERQGVRMKQGKWI